MVSAAQQQPVVVAKPLSSVVAVAASAGGLHALMELFSHLPRDFPAPIVVVQHLSPKHPSLLASILSRVTPLPVKQAEDGEHLRPGQAYIAPPDYHVLVTDDARLSLSHEKMVNFNRPSADVLFESLAQSFGPRAIAVVLSGSGTDGAVGVVAVKKSGGRVISQDEGTSQHYGMPCAAARTGVVDYVLPLRDIADMLQKMIAEHG